MTNENAAPGGEILFEALIVPHRSLTPRGIRLLTGSILFLSGIMAIRFWVLGAWPVAWFGLIEAGIAIGLVHLNVRQARASELVVLSAGGVRIVRTSPWGGRVEQTFPLGWLRVVLEERDGRVPALMLRDGSRGTEIAAALGEVDKRDLAEALGMALHDVRHPVFDNKHL